MADAQHQDEERQWSFKISLDLRENFVEEDLLHQHNNATDDEIVIPESVSRSFQRDGFIVLKIRFFRGTIVPH